MNHITNIRILTGTAAAVLLSLSAPGPARASHGPASSAVRSLDFLTDQLKDQVRHNSRCDSRHGHSGSLRDLAGAIFRLEERADHLRSAVENREHPACVLSKAREVRCAFDHVCSLARRLPPGGSLQWTLGRIAQAIQDIDRGLRSFPHYSPPGRGWTHGGHFGAAPPRPSWQ